MRRRGDEPPRGDQGPEPSGRKGFAGGEARRVLVPASLLERLRTAGAVAPSWHGRVAGWDGGAPPPDALRDATAVVLWHDDPAQLCRAVLDGCPRLDWIHSLWTGLEHLPAGELAARRVTVTTGRGVPAGPLAEWALLAVLWHFKRVDGHRERWSRGTWEPLEVTELRGSRITVLGLGSIGRTAARLFSGAGAEVLGVRRSPRPVRGCVAVEPLGRLAGACRESRALVVALPLTPGTRGVVGREVLAALPDGGVVVNLGRGEVVDEEALLEEVSRGRLAAALDVWWQEPPPAESPWWRAGSLLASPHSAYRTSSFRRRHAERAAENIGRYLEGRRLLAVTPRRELEAFGRVGGDGRRARGRAPRGPGGGRDA